MASSIADALSIYACAQRQAEWRREDPRQKEPMKTSTDQDARRPLQRLVRRLGYWMVDRMLVNMHPRPMYARRPVAKIVVYLLADEPDGPILQQWDWEITAAECPGIAKMNGFRVALEVAEEGCTQPNLAGSAHLSPDIPLFWSQNIHMLQPVIRRRIEESKKTSPFRRSLAGMGTFFRKVLSYKLAIKPNSNIGTKSPAQRQSSKPYPSWSQACRRSEEHTSELQ